MDMSLRHMLTKQLCLCLGLLLIISELTNGARRRNKGNGLSCKKMDVTLLLDSSQNVGTEKFQYVVQSARNLVEKLGIGPDNVHVAIITFGGIAQTHFDLNRFSNVADVVEALSKIPYQGGISDVSGAIRKMRTKIFTPTSGDRRGVPNLGIFISGGRSSNKQSAINEAVLARNSGIMLYYVGKLPECDFREFNGIVRKDSYSLLESYWGSIRAEGSAKAIIRRLCKFVPLEDILTDALNRENTIVGTFPEPMKQKKWNMRKTIAKPAPKHGSWGSSGNRLFTCTFEDKSGTSTLCGMVQSTADQFDWTLQTGKTPSGETGASEAFSKPYYVFIEASDPRGDGDTAILQLPKLNFNGEVCVKFACSMYGYHTGTLRLEKTDSTVLWSLSGDKGTEWLSQEVQISLVPDEQLQFAAVRGTGYSSDIGLDSIQVISGNC